MKVLVVGSRSFNDYDKVSEVLDRVIDNNTDVEIISGGARGADSLAERYAKEHNLALKVFPAYWDKYGKSAGYKRNVEMHKYISEFEDRICIAFWDGKSKGTTHNFELSKHYHTHLKVIKSKI